VTRRALPALMLALIACSSAALAAVASGDVNASLGKSLPDPEAGFTTWAAGESSVTNRYDYFVCGASLPSVKPPDFDYAGSACPALMKGTRFSYGPAGPLTGRAVYDRAHGIAFYYKGCCAWRGFMLAAYPASPPKPVGAADLNAVHTFRGVSLGMTQAQAEGVYGSARPHAVKGMPGVTALSYTTMKSKDSSEPCGQWQTFSFRQGHLISIELLAGC
jgi:hypothetical protein